MHLFDGELNSVHRGLKIIDIFNMKVDIFVSELGKFSSQHRGSLDAGDTDSDCVDLKTTVHVV